MDIIQNRVCFLCPLMPWWLTSCCLACFQFGYEWVYGAEIEIEKVFFINRGSFENSIKSSASKTHFHAENERVSRLTVFFSCNVVSPDNIYANNFSENLIEWVESLTQLTEQPDEQRSFTDWRVNHLVWMHEVVTCVIKLTMAKLTCITKQEIPEIVRQSCSFYWISRP